MNKKDIVKQFPSVEWVYDFNSSRVFGYENGEKKYVAVPKLINYKDIDWSIETNDSRTT